MRTTSTRDQRRSPQPNLWLNVTTVMTTQPDYYW